MITDEERQRARELARHIIENQSQPFAGNLYTAIADSWLLAQALHESLERAIPSAIQGSVGGIDSPWPAADVVRKLADAADILLGQHDYDGHGWEEIWAASDVARRWLVKNAAPQARVRRDDARELSGGAGSSPANPAGAAPIVPSSVEATTKESK